MNLRFHSPPCPVDLKLSECYLVADPPSVTNQTTRQYISTSITRFVSISHLALVSLSLFKNINSYTALGMDFCKVGYSNFFFNLPVFCHAKSHSDHVIVVDYGFCLPYRVRYVSIIHNLICTGRVDEGKVLYVPDAWCVTSCGNPAFVIDASVFLMTYVAL